MKKIFLILILILSVFVNTPVLAGVVTPRYTNNFSDFGYGIYFIPQEVTVYDSPDEHSAVLNKICWNKDSIVFDINNYLARKSVILFSPLNNSVGFAVVDEVDNWVKIVYNQEENLSGWIKTSNNGKFMTWLNFFNTYARKNGLYFLSDVENTDKTIYTEPSENAFVSRDSFYNIIGIEFKLIRGNWMLVKIVDMDKTEAIGWLKWRNNDNKLLVFPKF